MLKITLPKEAGYHLAYPHKKTGGRNRLRVLCLLAEYIMTRKNESRLD